jgi:hypothetical protein
MTSLELFALDPKTGDFCDLTMFPPFSPAKWRDDLERQLQLAFERSGNLWKLLGLRQGVATPPG